ncbi:unnamed protein product [Bathycoccus prasinos]
MFYLRYSILILICRRLWDMEICSKNHS